MRRVGVLQPPGAGRGGDVGAHAARAEDAGWQATLQGLVRAWPSLRPLLLAAAAERLAAAPRAQGTARFPAEALHPMPGTAACPDPALLRSWAAWLLAPPADPKPNPRSRRGAKRKAPGGGAGAEAGAVQCSKPWAPAPAQAAALLRTCLLALGAAAPCACARAETSTDRSGASGAAHSDDLGHSKGVVVQEKTASGAPKGPAGLESSRLGSASEAERLAALKWLVAALAVHLGAAAGGRVAGGRGPHQDPAIPCKSPASRDGGLVAHADALVRLAAPDGMRPQPGDPAAASRAFDQKPKAADNNPTVLDVAAGVGALVRARAEQAALLQARAPQAAAPPRRVFIISNVWVLRLLF